MSRIGVLYICRYTDPNFHQRLTRFVRSWVEHPPGIDCQVYVTYKEFPSETSLDLLAAQAQLSPLNPVSLTKYNDFNSFGGGCFKEALNHLEEPFLCTLVSTTEIMHDNWLYLLWDAFVDKRAGLVGCTGSKEGNLHIRDTAILIMRSLYQEIIDQWEFTSKDPYLDFEHGPNNLTIQVMRANLPVYVVECNRVIAPSEWEHTTYRGNMHNVLVHDRGARDFQDL